ncbi:Hsp70 family protein [Halobaculum sp. MBLA0147]|uniref:Hsp70 family protein n=1 Tax=Halobaculum sp. MBLA0147 TaxID=3079934 RepID=UPI003526989D
MSTTVGVDLGTTNTLLAVYDSSQQADIVRNREGEEQTPSVVHYAGEDVTVGNAALSQQNSDPENTVAEIKRQMGDDIRVEAGGNELRPEQVSADILKTVMSECGETHNEEFEQAVITVPAYWSDNQKKATKDAAEIAGIDVQRLLPEPTAAALSYGYDRDSNESKNLLVFDLGGGTFDLSMVKAGGGVFEVTATTGNKDLGGEDWTDEFKKYIRERIEEKYGDPPRDRQYLREHDLLKESDDDAGLGTEQQLRKAVKETKHQLASNKKATVSVPFIRLAGEENNVKTVEIDVTREEFQTVTSHLLEETRDPIQKAIRTGVNGNTDDVDDVLLVGGASRMPQVQDLIEDVIGTEPQLEDPERAVAKGAAIHGGTLDDKTEDIVLVDNLALSIGVAEEGGVFKPIIESGKSYPTERTRVFTTASDNQTSVSIQVYQGEAEMVDNNELLAQFRLTGIEPQPAGDPRIEVTMRIDHDGLLNVTATDRATSNSSSVDVEGRTGLSQEKIEELKRQAEIHAEEDAREKRLIKLRGEARDLIADAEESLSEYSDEVADQTLETVKQEMDALKSLLSESDPEPERLEDNVESLRDAVSSVGEDVYSSSSTGSLGES